jgi:hypothetical protein
VIAVCRRIIDCLPRRTIPSFAQVAEGQETSWKLRALCERSSAEVDDEPYGYRWPASAITNDDMRRLTVISNMTKIPCTKLLRLAVGSFFDETRSLMTELLHVHEATGRRLEDLISDDFNVRHFLPSKRSEPPTAQSSVRQQPGRIESPEPDAPERRGNTVLAAESPASPGNVAESTVSSSGHPRTAAVQEEHISSEQLTQVVDELRALRDETRVLWEAIDELREWADHTLRNPPEPPSPPLRIWSLASDPTAEDFGQRINAIPPEQMDALRQSLTPSAGEQPAATSTSQQRDLF